MSTDDTPLPGLEDDRPGDGAVTKAARRTLQALHTDGHLTESHAVMAATLLTLTVSLDRAATTGRAKEYALANLAAQIRETWTALMPEAAEGGDDDAWTQLADDLRSAAALRDPVQP